MAVDVQGAAKARPWLRKAKASYVALIDTDNKMSSHFNVNYIPLTILFDESGNMSCGPRYFNGNDPAAYEEVGNWVRHGEPALTKQSDSPGRETTGFESPEAELRFHLAAQLMRLDRKDQALLQLKQALDNSPNNLLILKQIWAIEHPDRFYEGDVDFAWQREQFKQRAQQGQQKGN